MRYGLFIGIFVSVLLFLSLSFNDVKSAPSPDYKWNFSISDEPTIKLSNHESMIFLTVPVTFHGAESKGTVYVNVHVSDGLGYEEEISKRLEDLEINETRNADLKPIHVPNLNPLTLKINLNPPPISKNPEHIFDTLDEVEIEFDATNFIRNVDDATVTEFSDKIVIDPNIHDLDFGYDGLIIKTKFASDTFEKVKYVYQDKVIYESSEVETTRKYTKSIDEDFEDVTIELYYKKPVILEAFGQKPIIGEGYEVNISNIPSSLMCKNDCVNLINQETINPFPFDETWLYILVVSVIGVIVGIILWIISRPRYIIEKVEYAYNKHGIQ